MLSESALLSANLTRTPLQTRKYVLIVEAAPATYKEFARLCLLLGGGSEEEGFELKAGVHVDGMSLRLRASNDARIDSFTSSSGRSRAALCSSTLMM